MAIINYYTKYGVSQTDDLDKIQWIINQKITDEENDSFGEGHSDKMFILQLAKEAFATAESKAKYDTELTESLKKRDPDGECKASLDKWYADAQNYYNSQQYDLAKTAIDRAMQFVTPETADSAFYDTAACIYFNLKLHSQALDLENQSIVLSPDEPNGYYLKSVFLYSYFFENNLGKDKQQDIWQQLINNCELTINKAISQGSGYNQAAKCYEYLAEIHYVDVIGTKFPISGNNNVLAEKYALKAISMMNGGHDDCPTAKKILNDIAARRATIAKLEQENADLLQNDIAVRRATIAKLEQENADLLQKFKSKKEELLSNFDTDTAKLWSKLKKDEDALNEKLREQKDALRYWDGLIAGKEKPKYKEYCKFIIRGDRFSGLQILNVLVICGIIFGIIGFLMFCFYSGGLGIGFVFMLIGGSIVGGRAARAARNKRVYNNYEEQSRVQSKIRSTEEAINKNARDIKIGLLSLQSKTDRNIRDNFERTNKTINNNKEFIKKQSEIPERINKTITANKEIIKKQSVGLAPKPLSGDYQSPVQH